MNRHDHITYICRKIYKFSGLFYRIRRIVTTKILLMLYYALVYPHLQYSIIDWGCACKTLILAPLQVIQNKIQQDALVIQKLNNLFLLNTNK